MADIWDRPIDKSVDWSGDEHTEGKPVSGRRVQEFIKTSLQSIEDDVESINTDINNIETSVQKKIGYIHDDVDNDLCLGFASESDWNLYRSDPETYASLLIQSWYNYHYHAPIPVTLDYPAYFGSIDNAITMETAGSIVPTLSRTTSLSASCGSAKSYVYVALYKNYRLTRAMTANNEDVLSDFVNVAGEFTLNSVVYKLYELHADSGLPLGVNISLSFSK